MSAPSPARVDALDGLRGLAILAVLLSHLVVYSAPPGEAPSLLRLAEFCSHGVDLFFALSGFLIFTGLRQTRGRAGWWGDFWRRRCAKILPLYAGLLLLVFAVLPPLLNATGFAGKPAAQAAVTAHWPWYAVFGSNALNFIEGRFVNPAVDVVWSLAVEVQFYLVVALLFAARPDGGSRRFWLGLALGAVALRCALVAGGATWVQVLVCTPARLDAFAAGALVAAMPGGLPNAARLVGFAGLIMSPPFLWSRESVWDQTVGYAWIALGCAALLDEARRPAEVSWLARVLAARPLRALGAISYALYLTHLPLRAALRDLCLPRERVLDSPAAWAAQLGFLLGAGALCVLVAALLWRFVERPAQRLILRGRRSTSSPPPPPPSAPPCAAS